MKNLKINKGNITKLILCVGIGGVITYSSITGIMHPEKVQETIPQKIQQVITGEEVNVRKNQLHLSNEEFLSRFEDIYYNSDNLQEEWKDIYPELKDFISKYGKYLKQDQILENLSDLNIVSDAKISGKDSLAMYDSKTNTIKFSSTLKYKKLSEIKKTKLHESLHFLFQEGFYGSSNKYKKTGIMIDEGLVSLLNQEYNCNDGSDNYIKVSNYVRILCEIIGEDEFMKAAGNEGLDYLVDKLAEYSSEKEAISLINNIERSALDYQKKNTDYDKAAWEIIDEMYKNKNGVSVKDSEDEIMKLYCNQTLGTYYDISGNNYSINVTTNKKYFINPGENSILIRKDSNINEIELDNENKPKSR